MDAERELLGVEDDDAFAERRHVLRLVGREHHGLAGGDLADDLPEPEPLLRVQPGRWLV